MDFWRRNFSLVACYSLKFTRCSLLVIKSLVTRCKIRLLLIVEVAPCKKSLVACCKIRSLLVAEVALCKKLRVTRRSCSLQKITRYSLQKLLVAKFACYSLQKLLVAKNHSLLVAEVARCKKSLVTRCKIRSLLVAKIHLLLIGPLISVATYYVQPLLTRANFS